MLVSSPIATLLTKKGSLRVACFPQVQPSNPMVDLTGLKFEHRSDGLYLFSE